MGLADLYMASKAGDSFTVMFAATATPAVQLISNPTYPVLVIIEASEDVYIKQGDSSVTVANTDMRLIGNTQWPLVVEGDSSNWIALLSTISKQHYNFLTISVSSTLLPVAAADGIGLFMGAKTLTGASNVIEYFMSTDTASGDNVSTVSSSYQCAVLGIAEYSQFAIAPSGVFGTATRRYTYAVRLISTSGTRSNSHHLNNAAGAGNTLLGVIGGGDTSSTEYNVTDKCTYATDTFAAGTVLSAARSQIAAAGNRGIGYYRGGYNVLASPVYRTTTDTYTYSTDAVAGGTALATGLYEFCAVGTSVKGYWAGGFGAAFTAIVQTYVYATDAVGAGTSLSAARVKHEAAGDSRRGIFGYGEDSGGTQLATSEKYTYATDGVEAGGALGTYAVAVYFGGTSNRHGGLQ